MPAWLSKYIQRKRRRVCVSLVRTYREISSASVDELWHKVVDLTDVSWHPILKSTNVPYGLVPKPGLIFQAVTTLVADSHPYFCGMCESQRVVDYTSTSNSWCRRKGDLSSGVYSLWHLRVLFSDTARLVIAIDLVFFATLCRPCGTCFSRCC